MWDAQGFGHEAYNRNELLYIWRDSFTTLTCTRVCVCVCVCVCVWGGGGGGGERDEYLPPWGAHTRLPRQLLNLKILKFHLFGKTVKWTQQQFWAMLGQRLAFAVCLFVCGSFRR